MYCAIYFEDFTLKFSLQYDLYLKNRSTRIQGYDGPTSQQNYDCTVTFVNKF